MDDWRNPVYDEDLLLYTMEKVGTTTVRHTVASAGLAINNATIHNITDFAYMQKKIITVARDPVKWAISYYFEMPQAHPNDIVEPENFGTVENFHKNLDIRYPESWFIHKFREIIGVNVYSKWFRREPGWEIYSLDRVLVLLTHRLSDTLIPALAEFTGKDESAFTLHPHERSMSSIRHGIDLEAFSRKVKFPRLWLLDNVLERPYCKHFFSIEERREMLDKWTI